MFSGVPLVGVGGVGGKFIVKSTRRGGGLAALSSLTSFASFAGLSTGMGTWKKEREERVGVGLVVMHHAAS